MQRAVNTLALRRLSCSASRTIACLAAPRAREHVSITTSPTTSLALALSISLLFLAGCGWKNDGTRTAGQSESQRAAAGDGPPSRANIDPFSVPDAVPRPEPRSRYGNPASYEQFGKRYYVMDSALGYRATGEASWYGSKFHGRRTSSGERYDMFKMTAAHPTLPIPSYVRVRHLGNGRQIVVRVNDRGPFHANRIIDLSWTAATKLGITESGVARVEIEALDPNDPIYAVGAEPPLAPTTPISTPTSAPASVPVRRVEHTGAAQSDPAVTPQIYTPQRRYPTPPASSVRSGPILEPLGPEPSVVEAAGSTGASAPSTVPPTASASTPPERRRSLYERLQTVPGETQASIPASAPTSARGALPPADIAYLQFGAFRDLQNATIQRDRLAAMQFVELAELEILDSQSTDGLYRVVSGPHTAPELAAARARASSAGIRSAVFRPASPAY